MNKIATARKRFTKLLVLTKPHEKILRAIHFYRYMGAKDVAHLLYSPSSMTYVRGLLSSLAGGTDFKTAQYLYRFQLPSTSTGGAEKIYTLGSKGRDFLVNELGLPVDCINRNILAIAKFIHNLVLTRFLGAAAAWATKQPYFKLVKTRICYELAKISARVEITNTGKTEKLKVIPIDRGMEYREKFRKHVRSRLEFIKKGGAYRKVFETEAVMIAYVTTGDLPEYRETRRKAMCAWTSELLADQHLENWSSIFRFASVVLEELYTCPRASVKRCVNKFRRPF